MRGYANTLATCRTRSPMMTANTQSVPTLLSGTRLLLLMTAFTSAASSAPDEVASSSLRANGSNEERSVAAMFKAMEEQMAAQAKQTAALGATQAKQMAQLHDEMAKKDEMIAALSAALKAKTEHRQVQLTAGGEVMQLVSEANFEALASRVAACEKTNVDQDAALAMTMHTLSKVRNELKDSRVRAPSPVPPPPQPPLPPPRPVAMPGRRLSSASVNEGSALELTGSNAVISWNSRTPGLTPFNCTGVGNGTLTCSGDIHAMNVWSARGYSVDGLADELEAVRAFVQMVPPSHPLPSNPPSPSYPPANPPAVLLPNPVAVASVIDGLNGFNELGGARGVATFVVAGRTYAIVTGQNDDGVQIIELTEPSSPVAVASVTDGMSGFNELAGATHVATFVVAERTYAIVTGYNDNGVQIIELTDPSSPVAVASVIDGVNGFNTLEHPLHVSTFVVTGRTYAIVTGFNDNGVQIIQLSA